MCEIFENVNDSYWYCNTLLTNIIDDHAPVKTRKIKYNHVPYMNSELRKAINVRNMLRRKHNQIKSDENWNKYKKYRNYVNSLRRKSFQYYVHIKCKQKYTNGKEYWNIIRPLMSSSKCGAHNIILLEKDQITTDALDVSNILNEHYITATQGIGQSDHIEPDSHIEDIVEPHWNKECINNIVTTMPNRQEFSFSTISQNVIFEKLININCNKATGHDKIPPKLIKLGAKELCGPITAIVNQCVRTSEFPSVLKRGEITPIFKKGDMMDKRNYRPVSTLPCLSKIFEGVLVDQINMYFENIFSPYISGFRKGHSCESVLLCLVENVKLNMDNGNMYGALLTDLSKAFECLPHRLLIAKLKPYGLSNDSCMLIANYFQNRTQRVKVGNVKSDRMEINKGCPQGSLFGPLAFNIFSNDLLLLVQDRCDVYNYADDNSIGIKGKDPNEITDKLSNVSSIMLRWFENNYLQANPDKFQFIIFNKVPKNCILSLNELVKLNSIQEVKLLGVTFDSQLTFKSHIGNICMKAGTKINALSRFCSVLDKQSRYEMFYRFILSYFKFCSVVWHNCSVSDMKKIENIQKRALRIIVNDSNATYRELRERSQRPLLYN